MVGVAFYAILVNVSIAEDRLLLLVEPYSSGLPYSLNLFNFERTGRWRDLPTSMERDIFTSLCIIQESNEEDLECVVNPPEAIIAEIPFPLCLNGWSGTNEKLIFVFSALNSSQTFIGTVGDSFENPAFSIVSFDFKTVQDDLDLHTVPVVTVLDKELNRLVTLGPASCDNRLNAIQ